MVMPEADRELFRRELLKGSTETLILSLLADESMYGYQLAKEMDERSGGYFRLKEGTLYPALHRLEKCGHVEGHAVEAANGQHRLYYQLTLNGQQRLESMIQEWDIFTTAVNLIAHRVSALA